MATVGTQSTEEHHKRIRCRSIVAWAIAFPLALLLIPLWLLFHNLVCQTEFSFRHPHLCQEANSLPIITVFVGALVIVLIGRDLARFANDTGVAADKKLRFVHGFCHLKTGHKVHVSVAVILHFLTLLAAIAAFFWLVFWHQMSVR